MVIWTFNPRNTKSLKPQGLKASQSAVPYQEKYFEVDIDHFNFHAGAPSSKTFQMRYLINQDNWDRANAGPILFYCGNEGDITTFWENTGFQTTTLAQEFKGLVLFAEHRYFGKSLPFGNDSFTNENLAYLTTEQALSDFVVFLRAFKSQIIQCEECPVIAFGGSYGGMLAAWIRMKFPNVVDGAIAASAPVVFFNSVTPLEEFNKIVTKDFKLTSTPQCASIITEGMKRLDALIANVSLANFDLINKVVNPCDEIKDAAGITILQDWLSNAYVYMAMVQYPYETNFLTHMPGNPVNFACQAFAGLAPYNSDEEVYSAMVRAAKIYYDYDNITTCNKVNNSDSAGNIDGAGWNVLACSEMILPMGSYGPNEDDMFPTRPWDYDSYSAMCNKTYSLQARYTWALDFFGGWDYENDYRYYSNIFFSNGKLDPWSAGGVLKNISDSMKAYYIEGAAHHLDLRLPHPDDPADVNLARDMERAEIRKWITEKKARTLRTEILNSSKISLESIH
eukprot:CAMPEP_0176458116 /NCGR_PEP_ID=MMETSP0127-20121128/32391_1 /TAXON_ID=938130 /ORGANISM="Platyophrya macrostoma, Strain WH" /LENGTH=507 /DNA_ID=CAMNT_0017848603 /DNA_START=77 /DNA_END=1601 /DNA_ORIENTATION=+